MGGIMVTHLRAGLERVEQGRDQALATGAARLIARYEQLLIQYEILIMFAERREAAAWDGAPPDEPPGEARHGA